MEMVYSNVTDSSYSKFSNCYNILDNNLAKIRIWKFLKIRKFIKEN
jgi:hypothetical protein